MWKIKKNSFFLRYEGRGLICDYRTYRITKHREWPFDSASFLASINLLSDFHNENFIRCMSGPPSLRLNLMDARHGSHLTSTHTPWRTFHFFFFFAKYFVYRTLINYAKLRILITYRTEWPKSHLAAESPCQLILSHSVYHVTGLTLTLLTCTKWRAPTNASKWRMGFNSASKRLILQ